MYIQDTHTLRTVYCVVYTFFVYFKWKALRYILIDQVQVLGNYKECRGDRLLIQKEILWSVV